MNPATTISPAILAVFAIHLVGVIILILVFGLVCLLLLYLAYYFLARKTNSNVDSEYKTKPGQTVAAPVTVTYHVDATYIQKGVQKTSPIQGAEVTFSLTTGDAAVDGTMKKVVSTGRNGDASVVLTPVRTGHDTLKLHLKAGDKEGDEQPLNFETVHR